MKNHPKISLIFAPLTLILALSLRLYYSLVVHPISDFIFSDMQAYYEIAGRIINGLPLKENIFYPPGYSLVLALITIFISTKYSLLIIGIINCLLGTFSALLIYLTSKRFLQNHISTLLLILLMIYYPQIDFAGYLLSETFTSFFLSLIVYLTVISSKKKKLSFYLIGLLVGVSSLIRANILITGLLAIIWAVFFNVDRLKKTFTKLRLLVISLGGTALSFVIIALIYYQVGGVYTIMPLNGGLNFMQGQCLIGHATDSAGWNFGPPVFMQRNIHTAKTFDAPFLDSNYFYTEGLKCLIDNPVRLLQKPLENYYMFFGNTAWPSSDQPRFLILMRFSHNLFNLLVLPGMILSLIFRPVAGRKYYFLLWMVVVSSLITSTIYYADIRYRIPYDGFYILLSLWGYHSASGYLKSKLHRG